MTSHTTRWPLGGFAALFVALLAVTRCASSSATPSPAPSPSPDDSNWIMSDQPCLQDVSCGIARWACESPSTLIYYYDNRCVAGHCQWQEVRSSCPCIGGICRWDLADDAEPDHAMVPAPDGGSCSDEGASPCELPRSVCADGRWLAYFTNGTCAAGQCLWAVGYTDCGGLGCANNGCVTNFTR